MKKSYLEIKPGDVFREEYGDFDNWVTIVYEDQEIEYKEDGTPAWLKTIGHYLSGSSYEGYSPAFNGSIPDYDVIGTEEEYKEKETL